MARNPVSRDDAAWRPLFAAMCVCLAFAYLILRVDPKLIFQAQEPVFFLDGRFAARFLSLPGGINDLAARFLSQFFYFAWTGAVLLVAAVCLVAWMARQVLRLMGVREPILYLHWVPAALVLALHGHYRFPLVLTLGLIWVLAAVYAFVRLAPSRPALRCVFFALIQACLYYVTAGPALVFAAVVVLHELLCVGRVLEPLGYAVFSGLLPYAAASRVFILHVPDAYTLHLASYDTYRGTWMLWVLYAFFPMAVLAVAWRTRAPARLRAAGLWDRLTARRSAGLGWVQGVLVLGVAGAAAWLSYEADGKAFLEMDYYARHGQWDRVVDCARRGMAGSAFGLCEANRALYHCGRLGDDLFSLPQVAGGKGLFLPSALCELLPLRTSDLFLDLGVVNEAQHWAHEAVSVTGESAWNLQRLALVNEAKADRIVADKYLGMLKKTLWHRGWARALEAQVSAEPNLASCPELRGLRANMPVSDFLVSPSEPQRSLEEMIQNARNRMAFEYYMAYCLLEGDLSGFVAHLDRLRDLGIQRLPRHYEEALLIYMQLTGRQDIPLPGGDISRQTRERFADFNRILSKYAGDTAKARAELTPYRDTYWFYGQYLYKPAGS